MLFKNCFLIARKLSPVLLALLLIPLSLAADHVQNDSADFAYPTNQVCEGSATILPSFVATAGGVFSAVPTNLALDSLTGAIDVGASPAGIYNVTHILGMPCPDTFTVVFEIVGLDDTTMIAYIPGVYCASDSAASPVIIGNASGTFLATSGIVFSNSMGTVDLAATAPGTYVIQYQLPGICGQVFLDTISVVPDDDPFFAYPNNSFCGFPTSVLPDTIATPGGVFASSPAGLIINFQTGEIDVPASDTGTYCVTYTTPGGCTAQSKDTIRICQLASAVAAMGNVPPEILLFPNPVKDQLNLELQLARRQPVRWQVVDLTGRRTFAQGRWPATKQFQTTIHLPNGPAGLYLLQLEIGEQRYVRKFTRQ